MARRTDEELLLAAQAEQEKIRRRLARARDGVIGDLLETSKTLRNMADKLEGLTVGDVGSLGQAASTLEALAERRIDLAAPKAVGQ